MHDLMGDSVREKVQVESNWLNNIEQVESNDEPATVASNFISKIAQKLQTNLSQLKFDRVKKSLAGSHVLYQQLYGDIPISDAWLQVDIDRKGKVYHIKSSLLPQTVLQKAHETETGNNLLQPPNNTAHQISEEEAQKIALVAIRTADATSHHNSPAELIYYFKNSGLTLTWKVILILEHPSAEWKIYIDANSGRVLAKEDMFRYITGRGKVFDPNPVVTLNDISLTQHSDIPEHAYTEVILNGLSDNGMLDGPFVSTSITPDRIVRADFNFLFTREAIAFKEVMVYHHIDTVHRYILSLGFDDLLPGPIKVHIDGIKGDQSRYSSLTKSIKFGAGGIDDAEDAEIIIHEYGHALLDAIVPAFGQGSNEAKAIGEAFGDYLAASFFYEKKHILLKPTIGTWNAIMQDGPTPKCLRRLDSNKKFKGDLTGEPHADAEIWSACLWNLRNATGSIVADQIIIESVFLLKRNTTFKDAATALVLADEKLNNGKNNLIVKAIFKAKELLID